MSFAVKILIAVLSILAVVSGLSSPSRYLKMESKYLSKKSPVFVAGGSRGVGYELIKQLSKLGTPVHALVRKPESSEMLSSLRGVTVTVGDALDEVAVRKAMNGCHSAVTLLGGRSGDRTPDSIGNSNVIEQAGILGVERIILMTSVGCGNTKEAVSKDIYKLFEETLLAKEKAEQNLKMFTNLDWTIVRPGGLRSEPATGKAILTETSTSNGLINRIDLASLLVRVLGSTGICTRRELTAIDPSQPSPYNGAADAVPLIL